MGKKRVLSCIQPTGDLHIGNYFGAIVNWVGLQDKYDCLYGVVDLHAMTMPYDSGTLRENTVQMFADLLACGVDTRTSVMFIQSLVPQHSELNWILGCLTTFGELTRMTQFKDKSDLLQQGVKSGYVSAGLFTYPVLMAADILLYNADYVPVGKDQEQHLELSRNVAVRFNNQFGEYFHEPEPLYTDVMKLMSLADPSKKMSKSLGNKHYIGVFESEESIRKKVRSAVTDTGMQPAGKMGPGVENLFSIIRACGRNDEYSTLKQKFENGVLQYKDLKEVTADVLIETLRPLRIRREELNKDKAAVEKLIHESSAVAREIAERTLTEVKKLAGLMV
jgi:tryptophanyl-tRNA synthetase